MTTSAMTWKGNFTKWDSKIAKYDFREDFFPPFRTANLSWYLKDELENTIWNHCLSKYRHPSYKIMAFKHFSKHYNNGCFSPISSTTTMGRLCTCPLVILHYLTSNLDSYMVVCAYVNFSPVNLCRFYVDVQK